MSEDGIEKAVAVKYVPPHLQTKASLLTLGTYWQPSRPLRSHRDSVASHENDCSITWNRRANRSRGSSLNNISRKGSVLTDTHTGY